MQVPAFDVTRQHSAIGHEIEAAMASVMSGGHFILGEHVGALEREVAAYCQAAFGIGVANGSDALNIALMALGVGPGDEVIVPAFTFFATAGAVARTGATPVFADIDPATFALDPQSFARAITRRTKAVIPVHLYGHPADMASILAIARDHDLRVVEDAAQAIGSEYQGRRVGSIGDFAALSFFPTKNLGAYGDAGMILTNDARLAERARVLRTHGAQKKYFHTELGYNSRLDELQAAVLRVKLPRLDAWTNRRQAIAAEYRLRIKHPLIELPTVNAHCTHVFHQFTVRCNHRAELMAHLQQHGVGCTVYYPTALHLQPVFSQHGGRPGELPAAEAATETVLSLPMFPEMTDEEIAYVAATVNQFEGPRS